MKTKIGIGRISFCWGLAIFAALSSSSVIGQQGEKNVARKTSGQGQTVAATAPASDAQSKEPTVLPIAGLAQIEQSASQH